MAERTNAGHRRGHRHRRRPAMSGTASRELNTPLPRWWLWMFYATIVWAIGYWIVYPAWPLVTSYTKRRVRLAFARRRSCRTSPRSRRSAPAMVDRIAAASLAGDRRRPAVAATSPARRAAPPLPTIARPATAPAAAAPRAIPICIDDDWLWGGTLDDIAQTIRHGVRSGDDNGRTGAAMPAFGRDNMLQRADIDIVADYVRSLVRPCRDAGRAIWRAARSSSPTIAPSATATNGNGNRELGAPNLTDKIWLYGPAKAAIVEGVINGRGAVMPAWGGRLDDTTIKALAVYVHSLGGGEK